MIVSSQPEVETLSIRTLGGLTIELEREHRTATSALPSNRQRVQFRTRTIEALLVYLARQRRPLSRDVLAEMLWPERSQDQARSNLRVALHRLREQLDPYVVVTRQDIALKPEAAVTLDVAQFEAHLAAAELTAATALYQGDFLEGFYLNDSPDFEQWALLERERLRTLALAAYQQLIGQQAAAGQLDAAIDCAQHLLVLDPLHEATHRQLMRLLALADQRSAALAQYETCRHLLAAELDVPPDEMTTGLYEQIRAGTLGLSPSAPAHLETRLAIGVPLQNLPPQPTPFIGRAAELAQIDQLLANSDCRLLTLLGVGGIGKTRLAVEAAARQAPAFSDGICFVPLAGVGTAEFAVGAIAQSLGLKIAGSDPQEEIAVYLRPRALLLVLDNFEHLLAAADDVAQLLQHAPQTKVLVTSRARLYLREEWLLPIDGLSLAAEVAEGVAEGVTAEADQLFLRSAQRVQPSFTGSGQEAAIAAICRQVEGMPLAIELAASWVRVMPCAEIARQIQANFDFLTTEVRNLPPRHRSLRALFDQSWCLLTPLEQEVLMRLSVFAGGWMPDEAATVTGATLALLLGLVDKSLVRAAEHGRFDLHELVRQYATAQLAARGEAELLHQRHYTAYLQFLRTADSHLRKPEAATWMARLQPELDNLRAALQWALDADRYEDAAWLMVAIHYYWYLSGRRYEGARWFTRLLPHIQHLPADLRLATMLCFYTFTFESEEFESMERYAVELQQLVESSSQLSLQSAAWYFLAFHTSDVSQAAGRLERAVVLARAANAAPGPGAEFSAMADRDFALASMLAQYASNLVEQGQFAQAAPLAEEGLQLFRARGDHHGIADCLGALGRLAVLQGDLAQARACLQEVISLATTFNYTVMQCHWQPLLGLITLYEGDIAEARRLLDESLSLSAELQNKLFSTRICAYLAETALWQAEFDQAAHWLGQSLAHYPDARSITIYQVERVLVAVRLAAAQQQYHRAATLFGLAEQLRSSLEYELIAPVRTQVDAALAAVRRALADDVYAEAYTKGQRLSLDAAFATILAAGHHHLAKGHVER